MNGPRGSLAPEVGGLGKKVDYPAPPEAEWVATDTPGVVRNTRTGMRQTNLPIPGPRFPLPDIVLMADLTLKAQP